jgi:hypothetical protein
VSGAKFILPLRPAAAIDGARNRRRPDPAIRALHGASYRHGQSCGKDLFVGAVGDAVKIEGELVGGGLLEAAVGALRREVAGGVVALEGDQQLGRGPPNSSWLKMS